jgi:hypothetical protein
MVGDYRYRIPGGTGNAPEATAQGFVNFDVYVEIQTDDDPETWVLIPGGHFTQPVPGVTLEACSTAAQAKLAIASLILARGLIQADRARRAVIALLPGGVWPESDITQNLEW